VQELKQQVDNFRNKLETTEHLSWLGEWFSYVIENMYLLYIFQEPG
jgi:hypothetical protein